MDTENAHETESSAMVAGGDGEKGTGEEKRKTGIALLKSPSPTTEAGKHGVTSLEDALSLVEKLEQIAVTGAPSVIPNKDVADFLSRKLARSIAYHPDVRNPAYIRELVDNGFSKRNAQKIVWTARKLSRSIPIDAELIQTSPVKAAQSKAVAIKPSALTTADQPKKPRHKRGHTLWNQYPRKFDGYNKDQYKREETPNNPKGTYYPDDKEMTKYGLIWMALGFQMVPEDLPKILPDLKESGLLDIYKVEPKLIRELEKEREMMVAAGKDMRLVPTPGNGDQVAASPI